MSLLKFRSSPTASLLALALALALAGRWILGPPLFNMRGPFGDEAIDFFAWQHFATYDVDWGWYLTNFSLVIASGKTVDECAVTIESCSQSQAM